jgi:hypothetical protein
MIWWQRVRLEAWLRKLNESTTHIVFKKNRNLHARLMLEQLRVGRLEDPFDTLPPEGPLPTLPKWLTYRYRRPSDNKERKMRSGRVCKRQ